MKRLNEDEIKALASLMDEEDEKHQEILRKHLLEIGAPAIPILEERCAAAEPRARARIEELLHEIRFRDLRLQFRRWSDRASPDLEDGVFLLARFRYPLLDETKYRRWLDATAAAVGEPSSFETDPRPALRQLNRLLFDELRFKGNTHRYYDPDNSFLNRVIDARTGIPISLSVLYMLVGRRLGLPLAGAGLPGHFMVLVEWERQPFFVDPFHEGRALSAGQCRDFLLSLGYPFHERYLVSCSTEQIVTRMIHNLISIYHKSGRPAEARRLTELVELLSSQPIQDPSRLLPRPPSP